MTPQQYLEKINVDENVFTKTDSRNKDRSELKIEVNDLVFVKPPVKYLKNHLFPFCYKVSVVKVEGNQVEKKYEETGGLLQRHTSGAVEFVMKEQLQKYTLGKDNQLLPKQVEVELEERSLIRKRRKFKK